MPLSPNEVNFLQDNTKKVLELWMRTRLAFLKAFASDRPSQEQEDAYLNLKSEISRLYRMISERLPPGLMFEGDKMLESLKNAMTLEHLHRQSATERQILMVLWHRIYIKITRTVGALEVMQSGYYPHLHRQLMRAPDDDATAKGKKKARAA